jgi:protein-tyrosine phosphatase
MIEDFKQWWQLRAQMRAVANAHKNAPVRSPQAVPQSAAPPAAPPANKTAAAPIDGHETDTVSLRVLMVCMGNICRSPIAEGVLRAKLQQAGLGGRVVVDSAGTHGYHTEEPPDPRSIRLAALRGYDIAGQRARAVVPEDFTHFEWLLAMDSSNLAWLNKRKPEHAQPRMALLMEHTQNRPGVLDVPDPYYGPDAGFELVLDYVEDACEGVVAQLRGVVDSGALGVKA